MKLQHIHMPFNMFPTAFMVFHGHGARHASYHGVPIDRDMMEDVAQRTQYIMRDTLRSVKNDVHHTLAQRGLDRSRPNIMRSE